MTAPNRRRWATALLVVLLVFATSPAIAAEGDTAADASSTTADDGAEQLPLDEAVFDPTDPEQVFRDIVFPVVGPSNFSPGFGACRDGCTREHKGIDILSQGWKGVPVVAAHDGVVTAAATGSELSGCWVEITAKDGWSTIYIHLNTDVPGTDLEGAPCLAPGVAVGSSIAAGTLIGWVGDSGNAEDTVPNLHFEIRNPDGISVDPWVSLGDARRIDYRWLGPSDVLEISSRMRSAPLETVYVVSADNVARLALPASGAAWINVPIVPIDPSDPGPAHAVLRDLSPDRIIVITGDDSRISVDDLYTYARIVEVASLPHESTPDVSTDGSSTTADASADTDRVDPDRYERVDAGWFTLFIAGSTAALDTDSRSWIESIGSEYRVIALDTTGRQDPAIGAAGVSRPDSEANRSYLWWNTSKGWQFSEDLDDAPLPGQAYLRVVDVNPWTLAFLTSLSGAPPMPVWHFQSTSRATRSL